MRVSDRPRNALALGPAGQMIAKAAITAIGAEGDGGILCEDDSVRFGGEALFLAADGEAGAHGVGLSGEFISPINDFLQFPLFVLIRFLEK